MNLYTTSQLVKLVGITPRQVHYWDKTNLLKPSFSPSGKRTVKYYSFINFVECRAVKSMLEQGISVQSVRKTLNFLRDSYPDLRNHFSEFKLITNGKDIFVIDKDGKGLKSPSGQLVMIIPFGDYYKEVEGLLKKKSVRPVVSDIESLKFVSDVQFWQSESISNYLEKEVNKSKRSKSLSLAEVKNLLVKSKKRKISA